MAAVVLECTNLPPYRETIQKGGLSIFNSVMLTNYVNRYSREEIFATPGHCFGKGSVGDHSDPGYTARPADPAILRCMLLDREN